MAFLDKRMKIEKAGKLVDNLHDKKEYVIHIRNLKQALTHGLVLKKMHGVVKLNPESWLKQYNHMNIELRKNAKNDFEKDFFKLRNRQFFKKLWRIRENIEKSGL